ncbi:nucleotidyltransferase family protein [Myxacorys almedinensis]|uniref:Nucleotidyltransferase n=1 Tax=Myxacorys almedinensis A TaxID=2690445 RepID=A0A8J7Z0K5_9CYAN|nr:nucleotidyltransferase family protein [Myxacorys almedinensis]NDJ17924.1 nucleotidyltransferase [Myxacorys almedinensis A]
MQRDDVLEKLRSYRLSLKEFNVKSLILFGSVARNEATPESDVDLLVEFEHPIGLLAFVRLQRHLETILGCSVDLGTPNSLKSYLKEPVLQESIRVF